MILGLAAVFLSSFIISVAFSWGFYYLIIFFPASLFLTLFIVRLSRGETLKNTIKNLLIISPSLFSIFISYNLAVQHNSPQSKFYRAFGFSPPPEVKFIKTSGGSCPGDTNEQMVFEIQPGIFQDKFEKLNSLKEFELSKLVNIQIDGAFDLRDLKTYNIVPSGFWFDGDAASYTLVFSNQERTRFLVYKFSL